MASDCSCEACVSASSAGDGAGNVAAGGRVAGAPFESGFSALAESRTSWHSAPAGDAIAESLPLIGVTVPPSGHAA